MPIQDIKPRIGNKTHRFAPLQHIPNVKSCLFSEVQISYCDDFFKADRTFLVLAAEGITFLFWEKRWSEYDWKM